MFDISTLIYILLHFTLCIVLGFNNFTLNLILKVGKKVQIMFKFHPNLRTDYSQENEYCLRNAARCCVVRALSIFLITKKMHCCNGQ